MNMAYFQLQATLILTAFLFYVIFTDKNVRDWMFVQSERLNIGTRILWMRIKLHPRNPVTNYVMKKKLDKVIKQIEEETKVGK